MKELGIVRTIDKAGRIVLPIEMRKELGIVEDGSKVEIKVAGNEIIMKKYESTCIFCRSSENLAEYNGQKICRKCIASVSKL